jgi:plastocyanin
LTQKEGSERLALPQDAASRENGGSNMRKLLTLTGLVGVVVVGLMATSTGAASRTAHRAALVTTIKVTAKSFKFILSSKTARRGVVVFKVTNVAAIKHNFSIKGRTTKTLSHGQSASLRVTFLRKGTYPYKCTVDDHASFGMKGVFTIK